MRVDGTLTIIHRLADSQPLRALKNKRRPWHVLGLKSAAKHSQKEKTIFLIFRLGSDPLSLGVSF